DAVFARQVEAHGQRGDSRVVGRKVEDISLPRRTTISVIVRGEEVLQAHHDTVVEAEDHVILFVGDRRQIAQVERLFRA
ncbi:MAG: Trk system potassium transporter TrkA, partial [Gammaproteobacteria bacterium]|nr:Trk system potassium transporter TrkA [Gammaproteobacteria bacterium]